MKTRKPLIKTRQMTFRLNFLSLFMLLFLFSCQNNSLKEGEVSDAEAFQEYIYAFTANAISKDDPVKIRFATHLVSKDMAGKEADKKILKVYPSVNGKTWWEDTQTLVFSPDAAFSSGEEYSFSIAMDRLFEEIPSALREFNFNVQVKDLFLNVQLEALQTPDARDLGRQQLSGKVIASDVVKAEDVQKILSAYQGDSELQLNWPSTAEERIHPFVITGIERGDTPSEVLVQWNGRPLKVDQKGEKSWQIPSLSDFKVIDAEAILSVDEQYVIIQFSDPLKQPQDLDGLIELEGFTGQLRFSVDGSRVLVYPSSRLSGEYPLKVHEGIKNSGGSSLSRENQWLLRFEEVKPAVRLVGQGVVLPNSEGLLFPFEAIGLRYVEVEIQKVYNNNILQFLQTNALDGNYEMERVGKIVLQKRISLNSLNNEASSSRWMRYALDLADLIDEDPYAIYMVSIGFRPGYGAYPCGNDNTWIPSEEDLLMQPAEKKEDPIQSFWGGYYGINGYYQGFEWHHREDPCYPAYYNYQRFVRRNVFSSNIGLIAKGEPGGELYVVATDLRTTRPLQDVQLELYNYPQQLLGKTTTNDKGIGSFSFGKDAFVVVASYQGEKGYLKVQDGQSLSLSRFDVSGVEPKNGMKGYFYGERGVWRPGDSLYLNFVLENKTSQLPDGHPVAFEVRDPRGNLHTRISSNQHAGPIYPFYFATSKDDPTGSWTVTATVGGASFTKGLSIETIKPNRLKIDLDLGKDELMATDKKVNAQLQINWLHGAPARNIAARVEFQPRAVKTNFPAFKEFEFDDPARKLVADPEVVFDRQVDQNGAASFTIPLDFQSNVPGKLNLGFRTRAFETGGGFSSDNYSVSYSPFESYAGLRIPKDQYGGKRIDLNDGGEVELTVVDESGKPLSGKNLSVGVYRLEWRWWWDSGDEYLAKYNSSNHLNALAKGTAKTNDKGVAVWPVTVDNWGRYLIRVCDTESGHCSGDFFYAGYPWYEQDDDASRQALAMLNFSSDKESYSVGEEVTLSIPAGDAGRCLISLETGGKVLQTFWKEVKKGDNTFAFRNTSEMAPTVYAHVSLLQPHAQGNNDRPIRMYGVIPIEVVNPDTRLTPVLKMQDELAPEQEFNVEIKEEKGQAMAYTLAIVDEGLLDLTRFKTPSPWNSFYAKEALGIKTWDLYDQVLGAYGGQLENILGIGGDGAVDPSSAKESANRFKPVVMHVGPFYLNKGKTAVHRLKMPNYVGSVRAMLVCADNGAYGSVEKTIPVKKPLMVLATLPRVLGPGESLSLPVTVFAMDEKVKNVTLSVEEVNDRVEWTDTPKSNLRFEQTGDQVVYFDFKVKEEIGVARFRIKASSGGETASQEIEMEIRSPNPEVLEVVDKVLPAGESWEGILNLPGIAGTNELALEVSTIPPIDLGRRLQYLLRYPYGCVEQTTSSGFPQLYVKQLMEVDGEMQKRMDENITATILRLQRFQQSSGGFSYWPGNRYISDWGSTYAGHFLLEAKALGYSVSDRMIEQWARYQSKVARFWADKPDDYRYRYYDLGQAYRLYTLALAQQPEMGAMNRLRESSDLTLAGKWRLAAAYALAGQAEIARQMVADLETEVETYRELGGTYGSSLRDQAMILETLTLLGEKDRASRIVRKLATDISKGRWFSTQTTAYALLAIGKFAGDAQLGKPYTFSYKVEGQEQVEAGGRKAVFRKEFERPDQIQGAAILLSNTGENQLFLRLIKRGQPLAGAETNASEDLKMKVSYKDMTGNPITVDRIPQGTDFYAEVSLTNPGTRGINYDEMALEQIFPSGWEILNTRLSEVSGAQGSIPEYQDIRDDRVYTFFDLRTTSTFRVMLNAAYPGRYYLPAVQCSAMYDYSIMARQAGQWVEVVVPGEM
jgi:uncharacterized protein YfaS (alpha-2-macroglobulin family)